MIVRHAGSFSIYNTALEHPVEHAFVPFDCHHPLYPVPPDTRRAPDSSLQLWSLHSGLWYLAAVDSSSRLRREEDGLLEA